MAFVLPMRQAILAVDATSLGLIHTGADSYRRRLHVGICLDSSVHAEFDPAHVTGAWQANMDPVLSYNARVR